MLKTIGCLSRIMIWLLMAISTMARSPAVLDTTRQAIRKGVKYYILPAAADTAAGGLTLMSRSGSCPSYVGQEPLSIIPSLSQGLAVVFTPCVANEIIVRESSYFKIRFSASTSCKKKSTTWNVAARSSDDSPRRYIVTGGEGDYFRIVKNGTNYYLSYCLVDTCDSCRFDCGTAGITIDENGKRFLTLDGPAFAFRFKMANPFVNYPYEMSKALQAY